MKGWLYSKKVWYKAKRRPERREVDELSTSWAITSNLLCSGKISSGRHYGDGG